MNEAEKNAETVRRGYEAFNKADMQTLTELFDEGAS
jgi:ketosteroid isomerase-like protein